ncbi:MAG: 4Fe-4S dicluster domain-containing protein [Candidatus Caldarchaeum sp.]
MKPAMVIDLNRCVGCYACVEACITENIARINPDNSLSLPKNPPKYARTRPYTVLSETNRRRVFIQCLHCEDPPCVHVCPTGASYRSPEGVVLLNDAICIKCGLCIDACPYGVRVRLLEDFPGKLIHEHSLKTAIPDKCTFCYHRKNGDGLWSPACVDACSFDARLFGDLDNPDDPVTRLVRSGLAVQPRAEFKTNPKLYYIPRKGAFELVKYPAQTTSTSEFNLWTNLKNSLLQPLTQLGMVAAVVLGSIHIIREMRRRGGKHAEGKKME